MLELASSDSKYLSYDIKTQTLIVDFENQEQLAQKMGNNKFEIELTDSGGFVGTSEFSLILLESIATEVA